MVAVASTRHVTAVGVAPAPMKAARRVPHSDRRTGTPCRELAAAMQSRCRVSHGSVDARPANVRWARVRPVEAPLRGAVPGLPPAAPRGTTAPAEWAVPPQRPRSASRVFPDVVALRPTSASLALPDVVERQSASAAAASPVRAECALPAARNRWRARTRSGPRVATARRRRTPPRSRGRTSTPRERKVQIVASTHPQGARTKYRRRCRGG